jgi:hypothetical protein
MWLWPWSNTNELNLDWILCEIKKMKNEIDNFDVNLEEYVDNWLTKHPEYVTTVQDGSISRPKLTNELYAELRPRYIDVKTMGATGDGTTDDTSAINAAFQAAKTQGLALFFPVGTYNITETIIIDAPIEIFGNGRDSLIQNQFGEVFQAGTYIYARDDFTNQWIYYINIHDLAIRSSSSCIHCRACSRSRFYNLWLTGYGSSAVGITVGAYTHWNIFTNLSTENCRTGIDIVGEGASANYNATGNIYSNIAIIGNALYGIWFHGLTFGDAVVSNINGVLTDINAVLVEIDGRASGSFYHSRISVNGLDLDGVGQTVARVRSCYDVVVQNYVVGGRIVHKHPLIYNLTTDPVLYATMQTTSEINADPYPLIELRGTGTITTINGGYYGRELRLLPRESGISLGTGGNIQVGETLAPNRIYKLFYHSNFWWIEE